jgi:hypothetical protein
MLTAERLERNGSTSEDALRRHLEYDDSDDSHGVVGVRASSAVVCTAGLYEWQSRPSVIECLLAEAPKSQVKTLKYTVRGS